MSIVKLLAENHIDPEAEAAYQFITQSSFIPNRHTHNFFEIFLVISGRVIHHINGEKQVLEEGSLVFVRDFDVHYYENCYTEKYHFINLAFLSSTLKSLLEYIGSGYPLESLLKPDNLQVVKLSVLDCQELRLQLESLAAISRADKQNMRSRLRILIFEIFTRFFTPEKQTNFQTMSWLENLKMEMKKNENFSVGIQAMQRLAQKHPDYLSRAWKKFDNKTPTEFVTELRLEFVANLLHHSDESILNIALAAGFENLSYFYHVFRKKFGTTPLTYRKLYMENTLRTT